MKNSFLLGCLFFYFFPLQANEINMLLRALDHSIPQRSTYFAEKEKKLDGLKNDFIQSSGLEQKYETSKKLMVEYSYYMIDSALHYSDVCLQYARKLHNDMLVLETQLEQAHLMCYHGMVPESFKILQSIDPDTLSVPLRKKYYHTYIHVHHNHIIAVNFPSYIEKYREEAMKCIGKYLELGDEENAEYLGVVAYRYYLLENYKEAITVVKQILEMDDITPYVRAEMLYILGSLYLKSGNENTQETIKLLANASIIANELVMTRNTPLLNLALLLANDNRQIKRAYRYINVAFEDVKRFNSTQRISKMDKTNAVMQNLNYIKVKRQRVKLQISVAVLMLFVLITIVILFKLSVNNMDLKNIRKKLSDTNLKLRDSNRIKDTYIIHFLNRYSTHLNKVDGFKNNIIRQLNTSQPNDIIKKEAMRSMNTHDDFHTLFEEFDKSVLELYPDFIEQVNGLLKDDKKYDIEKKNKLNTELRILALLRLGISDHKQIASFFRFTVQTVYNYRSKAKLRAINEETFDDDIKHICKFS